MQITFYDEPELEFGTGSHIDIRYGLSTHGSLDFGKEFAPTKVRLGLVGDQDAISRFNKWLKKCRGGIAAKKTTLDTLFPPFPGFGEGKPLCDFVSTDQSVRTITGREIRRLSTIPSREDLVSASVDCFLSEANDLLQSVTCDVIVCLPPPDLLKSIDAGATNPGTPRSRRKRKSNEAHKSVWHDLLKARGL